MLVTQIVPGWWLAQLGHKLQQLKWVILWAELSMSNLRKRRWHTDVDKKDHMDI